MSDSPAPIFAATIGAANTHALYWDGKKIEFASAPATWPDLMIGITEVTKKLRRLVGGELTPLKSVLTGNPTVLEALPADLTTEVISEADAVAALEKTFSKVLGLPTAILDLGASAYLDHYPAEEVGRWLTFSANLTDLENYLANRKLFPRALPLNEREYEIDLAAARQAVIKLGEREGSDFLQLKPRMNLILTGGIVAGIKDWNILASLVLDSFYFPAGVTVYLDSSGSLTQLGAALAAGAEFGDELIRELTKVGTFLHLGGTHKLTLEVGNQRLLLMSGELLTLPAGPEDELKIQIMTGQSMQQFNLSGGVGGIYLDNRPRPLGVAPSSRESAAKILAWRKALSTSHLFEEGAK